MARSEAKADKIAAKRGYTKLYRAGPGWEKTGNPFHAPVYMRCFWDEWKPPKKGVQ